MKVRVVYRPDGTVAVLHHAPKSALTFEAFCAKATQGELAGLPFDDIDSSGLPQTRTYREAWRGSKGQGVHIDAAKKAEIDARVPLPTVEELAERIAALETQASAEGS
jgi:hypothetical protein